VSTTALADADTLWVGTIAGAVSLWDLGTGKELRRVQSPSAEKPAYPFANDVTVIKCSPRRRTTVIICQQGEDTKLRVLDVQGREFPGVSADDALSAEYSSDGSMLAQGDVSGSVSLWNMADGTKYRMWMCSDRGWAEDLKSITDLSFSPDRRFIACADRENRVSVWQIFDTRQPQPVGGHAPEISSRHGISRRP